MWEYYIHHWQSVSVKGSIAEAEKLPRFGHLDEFGKDVDVLYIGSVYKGHETANSLLK